MLILFSVLATKSFVLNVKVMITIPVSAIKNKNGYNKFCHKKQMQSGLLQMPRFVLGAKKQLRDQWGVTSCHVHAVKVFAICVLNLGSLTIRTISSAIFLKKSLMR
jgi:hypothetical protein